MPKLTEYNKFVKSKYKSAKGSTPAQKMKAVAKLWRAKKH